jgi:hypothetical protein
MHTIFMPAISAVGDEINLDLKYLEIKQITHRVNPDRVCPGLSQN